MCWVYMQLGRVLWDFVMWKRDDVNHAQICKKDNEYYLLLSLKVYIMFFTKFNRILLVNFYTKLE